MKKSEDSSIKRLVVAGFAIVIVVQVLGFWWLAHLGVQRTGEIMQSQRAIHSTEQ
ncbi:MAG: hypothetical protein ACM3KF_02905 [Acidobacteriota bacterium]